MTDCSVAFLLVLYFNLHRAPPISFHSSTVSSQTTLYGQAKLLCCLTFQVPLSSLQVPSSPCQQPQNLFCPTSLLCPSSTRLHLKKTTKQRYQRGFWRNGINQPCTTINVVSWGVAVALEQELLPERFTALTAEWLTALWVISERCWKCLFLILTDYLLIFIALVKYRNHPRV